MFTGIVQEVGRVEAMRKTAQGAVIAIHAPQTAPELNIGDSVCTQGVCLTVVEKPDDARFTADISVETLNRTTLGSLSVGDPVNLEPALRLSDRLGGHLVTGHVDGTGHLVKDEPSGNGRVFTFQGPPAVMRYVIHKGSICVDGISLTVADVNADTFQVALIPHTLNITTLGTLSPGAKVNLEADLIGKYVERLLNLNETNETLEDVLARSGFIRGI